MSDPEPNPYCLPADLAMRKDVRTLCELASDTSHKVQESGFATDPVILQVIDDATGDFHAAMLSGGLYTLDDLASLDKYSLAKVQRFVSERAIAYLLVRRPKANATEQYKAMWDLGEQWLDDLRRGKAVFGSVTRNIAAGTPSDDGPTAIGYKNLRLLRDRCGTRVFPARAQNLPFGRGSQ